MLPQTPLILHHASTHSDCQSARRDYFRRASCIAACLSPQGIDHRFERDLSNVTATYGLRSDGTISAVNRGLNQTTCEWDSVEGSAEFIEIPDVGSLSVTFFWPIKGGYHIFALDKQNYQWAAVSGPTKDYLWILARQPSVPADVKAELVKRAGALGFPVDELIEVTHGSTGCGAPS